MQVNSLICKFTHVVISDNSVSSAVCNSIQLNSKNLICPQGPIVEAHRVKKNIGTQDTDIHPQDIP